MKKYLVLKGCAGLGNRFITLMKAIRYAEISKRVLYVDWSDGMFGSKGDNVFYKYFELKNIDNVKNMTPILQLYSKGATTYPYNLTIDDFYEPIFAERTAKGQFMVYTPFVAKNVFYKIFFSLIPLHKFVYVLGLQSFQRIEKKNYISWIKVLTTSLDGDNFPLGSNLWPWLKQDIVFFADFRPLISMKHFFEYVSLKKEYQIQLENIAHKMDLDNCMGVHIRYTDKKPKSKLNKLIDTLKYKLELGHAKYIFLCSDNNDIVEEFKSIFGNKIKTYEKFIPHVEDGGIHIWAAQNNDDNLKLKMFEDSLTEMWLLSMTKELYWQGNSSFSYISKLLALNETIVKDWMKL